MRACGTPAALQNAGWRLTLPQCPPTPPEDPDPLDDEDDALFAASLFSGDFAYTEGLLSSVGICYRTDLIWSHTDTEDMAAMILQEYRDYMHNPDGLTGDPVVDALFW